MQWLDREFWNLYKMATLARAAPNSAGAIHNQPVVSAGRPPVGGSSGTETVARDSSSVSAADEWSNDEQRRLEAALVSHPSSLEPKQRWRLISADVGSKSAGQCIARFKFIRETLKSGGSVAAAEAKVPLVLPAGEKQLVPMKSHVPPLNAPVSESSMPPIEIPDDLLTMTGVIAGAGMCSGLCNVSSLHFIVVGVISVNSLFSAVRMEDVVYDGWDVSVAHTVSLQVTFSSRFCVTCMCFASIYFLQMQCQRCKCRLAIVFPPEGVPSLEMLLDSGSSERDQADELEDKNYGENDGEFHAFGGGHALEETNETDDSEHDEETVETEECDGSSSDGDSDADNGMGRKTGAVRVMVESFADRCNSP